MDEMQPLIFFVLLLTSLFCPVKFIFIQFLSIVCLLINMNIAGLCKDSAMTEWTHKVYYKTWGVQVVVWYYANQSIVLLWTKPSLYLIGHLVIVVAARWKLRIHWMNSYTHFLRAAWALFCSAWEFYCYLNACFVFTRFSNETFTATYFLYSRF